MLSQETIFEHLPKLPFAKKRYLPEEKGVYFFITNKQLIYIGISNFI